MGKLKRKVVDETFEYKGQILVVPDYIIYQCAVCEESLVDRKSVKSFQKASRNFFTGWTNDGPGIAGAFR